MRHAFVLIISLAGLMMLSRCSDDPAVIIVDDPCEGRILSLIFSYQAVPAGYELTATINNGVGPYSFLWSTGDWFLDEVNTSTTTTVTDPENNVSLSVYDADSCWISEVYNICEHSMLAVNILVTDDDMSTTATGGDLPYQYLWSDGSTDPDRTDLPPGTYCVTVTDNGGNGCVLTDCSSVLDTTYGSFTDPRDGTSYRTIEIGSQNWMAENLRYEVDSSWCYNGNTVNCDIYGRLYNWYAALNSCPDGWHLPTDEEWTALTDFLGGDEIAGGKLKSTGTTLWRSPNTDATNSSGFTGLPGGGRGADGSFMQYQEGGFFWTSTEHGNTFAYYRSLGYNTSSVTRTDFFKSAGMSVRCVQD